MNAPDRSTTAGAAYLDLRKLAKETGRPTDELHQLYALEGFLRRLTLSPHASSFVLKGGVLLAAYTDRRATRDIDLAARRLQADVKTIRALIADVTATPIDDGLEFDSHEIDVDTIRDDAEYPGLRAKVTGRLASATIHFHIDINIGDPLWPEPRPVKIPRLLEPSTINVAAYPPELILAEKIVTAIQRGSANTRWRDFVDIASLASTLIDTETLVQAINRVANHRRTEIEPLAAILDGYAQAAQPKYAAWRRKHRLDGTPAEFEELLTRVIDYTDPILQAVTATAQP
ncbi:MAG: nucleotidyl transferase AbiEii/AbiGii toxin family protein [bacterium]|nr:nucleotidyl transferase AbiEii/AbiGii toxin family protein [bacterium]